MATTVLGPRQERNPGVVLGSLPVAWRSGPVGGVVAVAPETRRSPVQPPHMLPIDIDERGVSSFAPRLDVGTRKPNRFVAACEDVHL